MFARREVNRSFRKFNDLAADLHRADFRTWEEGLRHLLAHCEEDPVMREVTGSLKSHPKVNLDQWHKAFLATCGGMVGSGRYSLPREDEERTSLLYQFLIAISEGKIRATDFCIHAFGTGKFQEMVYKLNTEIVSKFTRELSYRLREVETDLGDKTEVDSSALMVFHYHGPVQSIQGGVHGGIVAANSTVTGNKVTYNDASQLARAVKSLGDDLNDVLEDHRESVSGAFALLVKAIETNTVPKPVEVASAAEAINDGSPTGLARLKGIMDGAAGNVLGNLLTPLFAYYCGVSST